MTARHELGHCAVEQVSGDRDPRRRRPDAAGGRPRPLRTFRRTAVPSKYAALIRRFGVSDYAGDAEQQIGTLLQALLQRGIDDGTFRGDLTAGELLFLLGSLLEAAARMTAEHLAGVEKAAALVTSVFLHGTQNSAGPAPRQGQDQG